MGSHCRGTAAAQTRRVASHAVYSFILILILSCLLSRADEFDPYALDVGDEPALQPPQDVAMDAMDPSALNLMKVSDDLLMDTPAGVDLNHGADEVYDTYEYDINVNQDWPPVDGGANTNDQPAPLDNVYDLPNIDFGQEEGVEEPPPKDGDEYFSQLETDMVPTVRSEVEALGHGCSMIHIQVVQSTDEDSHLTTSASKPITAPLAPSCPTAAGQGDTVIMEWQPNNSGDEGDKKGVSSHNDVTNEFVGPVPHSKPKLNPSTPGKDSANKKASVPPSLPQGYRILCSAKGDAGEPKTIWEDITPSATRVRVTGYVGEEARKGGEVGDAAELSVTLYVVAVNEQGSSPHSCPVDLTFEAPCNLLANPSFETPNDFGESVGPFPISGWRPLIYNSGQHRHLSDIPKVDGDYAFMIMSSEDVPFGGIGQLVALDSFSFPIERAVTFSLSCFAAGHEITKAGIYADIRYQDGTHDHDFTISIAAGTSNWKRYATHIQPAKPASSIFVYVISDGPANILLLDQCSFTLSYEDLQGTISPHSVSHPWTLPYFVKSSRTPSFNEVTAVTQLSVDRLSRLQALTVLWNGPVSAAVYIKDTHDDMAALFSLDLKNGPLKNVDFHVVFQKHASAPYPINYLRNVATSNARTEMVFLLDVDFLPRNDMHAYLMSVRHVLTREKTAFVVPAFEYLQFSASDTLPGTKEVVVQSCTDLILQPVHMDKYMPAHFPTDYEKWYMTDQFYSVPYAPDYEPYVVLSKEGLPQYDDRFSGYGHDKDSHLYELHLAGYDYMVVPDAWIIHMAHEEAQWSTQQNWTRSWLNWSAFQLEMDHKYRAAFEPQPCVDGLLSALGLMSVETNATQLVLKLRKELEVSQVSVETLREQLEDATLRGTGCQSEGSEVTELRETVADLENQRDSLFVAKERAERDLDKANSDIAMREDIASQLSSCQSSLSMRKEINTKLADQLRQEKKTTEDLREQLSHGGLETKEEPVAPEQSHAMLVADEEEEFEIPDNWDEAEDEGYEEDDLSWLWNFYFCALLLLLLAIHRFSRNTRPRRVLPP